MTLAMIDEFVSLVLTFWVNNVVDWFLMNLSSCFLKILSTKLLSYPFLLAVS
jgi:hypothetical protein